MKHQVMSAPDGLWCVYIHNPFAEDVAERSLEAEPVLYIEVDEYEDTEDVEEGEEPETVVTYTPVVLYSSELGLSAPAELMYRLYWATSRGEALAKHDDDPNNLIFELTHDHSAGSAPEHPSPRMRPSIVH